jgi:hypothetical protein
MVITHAFSTGYELKDIDVAWKMFYRKAETQTQAQTIK